jgi:thiosulfate/3-mercaptopyruvate sulfurtransferase
MVSHVLIEVGELVELLRSPTPLVLADVRWTLNGPHGRPEFEQSHLPGAQWVDLENELSAPPGAGGRHPLPQRAVFQAAMRRIGVRDDVEVVCYDAANALAASRLWWLLTDAGHRRVRVLNGGLAAWVDAGQPTEHGPAPSVAEGTFTVRPGQRTQLDGETIADRLRERTPPTLVDVRAVERYAGETEPIDPVAGHIPTAVSRPSMANVDGAGRFLDPQVLAGHYEDLPEPVFYCGSGITAAHSLLALEAAGRTDGRIYPGSWSDWITDPERGVATGRTP